MVEHLTLNQGVRSSSLRQSTSYTWKTKCFFMPSARTFQVRLSAQTANKSLPALAKIKHTGLIYLRVAPTGSPPVTLGKPSVFFMPSARTFQVRLSAQTANKSLPALAKIKHTGLIYLRVAPTGSPPVTLGKPSVFYSPKTILSCKKLFIYPSKSPPPALMNVAIKSAGDASLYEKFL